MAKAATPAAILIVAGVGLIYYAIWSPKGVLRTNPVTGGLGNTVPPTNGGNTGGNGIPSQWDNDPDFSKGWALLRYNARRPVYNVDVTGISYQDQLTAFRNAIGQGEGGWQSKNASGHVGRYQIREDIWNSWSRHYFGRVLDWHNPANQDAVFNARVTQYYTNYSRKFGADQAWIHTAAAWSRGPATGSRTIEEWFTRPSGRHGYIYASQAMRRMELILNYMGRNHNPNET